MALRIAFMGSPVFAVPTLEALHASDHEIVAVYSQPPRPAGRGKTLRPTPVQARAEELGLEVRTPENFRAAEDKEAFAALDLDIAIVVAYGLILPRAILNAPRLACVNIHGSLLPRWRGAAPIHRAVMAGDRRTGVQTMIMERGLDTGPVLLTADTEIGPGDTTGDIHDRLALLGADIILPTIEGLLDGSLTPTPQSEDGVTYADKVSPEEARVDWSQDAKTVDRHIRGLSPAPGAWFHYPGAKGEVRMKALRSELSEGQGPPGTVLDEGLTVACGDGAVRLLTIQKPGKGPMSAEDFLRGLPTTTGTVLS